MIEPTGQLDAEAEQFSLEINDLPQPSLNLDLVPHFDRADSSGDGGVGVLEPPRTPPIGKDIHLPDVIVTTATKYRRTPFRDANGNVKHRNTLHSFPQLPYLFAANSQRTRDHNGHNGGVAARRTKSVSLPIDHDTVVSVAGRLRQMGEEFSTSFQVSHYISQAHTHTHTHTFTQCTPLR